MNGMVYTQQDVNTYLKKINANDKDQYFKPLDAKRVVYKMLEELVLCYRYKREDDKANEIQELMNIIAGE
jgi:hypothetical protein